MSKRKVVNDVDFFFALPSSLKRKMERAAKRRAISAAAFARTAITRLLEDLYVLDAEPNPTPRSVVRTRGRDGITFR